MEKYYDLMKKYYLMDIEKGNSEAMFNFGNYYRYIEKNYDLMEKYYLMASDHGHVQAIKAMNEYHKRD
jgi:TPR repeat protein